MNSKFKKNNLFIVLFLLVFLVSCAYEKKADTGDIVDISYTISNINGSLMETNIGAEPLSFVLGAGTKGGIFDNIVAGMKKDEARGALIRPREEERASISINRTRALNRIQPVQKSRAVSPEQYLSLFGKAPKNGSVVNANGLPWDFLVSNIGENSITLDIITKQNTLLTLPDLNIKAKVLNISGPYVWIELMPVHNKMVETSSGNYTFTLTNDSVLAKFHVSKGQKVAVDGIHYIVNAFDNQKISLDIDQEAHPSFVVKVTLLSIKKG